MRKNRLRRRFTGLTALLTAALTAIGTGLSMSPPLLAQMETSGKSSADIAGVSPATWAIPYIIVIVTLGLGVFLVILSSKRQDRPKKDI